MVTQPGQVLTPAAFDELMAPLGPFEPTPHLAVAVSGGRDSLALALLASQWARTCAGRVTPVIVDHGLRPASAAEARQAVTWLRPHGIAARVLTWRGVKPRRGVQAAARAARYALLEEWCRAAGVVHLLLAHQRDDQAETFLLRLGRGSGLDGLAAMAHIVERPHLRLLRPLLTVPRRSLAAYLHHRGQAWIDDPSNDDVRLARARLRVALPALASDGLSVRRLAATACRLGAARQLVEAETAALLARAVAPDPAGFLVLDAAAFGQAADEIALRALARCLTTMGAAAHPPRLAALQRLDESIRAGLGRTRTLGGCRIAWWRGSILLSREVAAIGADLVLHPGMRSRWDSRFRVAVGPDGPARMSVRALGAQGWRQAAPTATIAARGSIPAAVRATLPAVWRGDCLLAVPHLGWARYKRSRNEADGVTIAFAPDRPLAAASFGIVSRLPAHYV